jgi:hypothetical protein
MNSREKLWIRLALINLCLVAFLGTLMRYKIGFEFPYFNQKYIQEAHSHFAFTGWITHALFFLMVSLFRQNLGAIREKIYYLLILANVLCSYGMLVSFFMEGYGPVSISFSTLSILIAYVFSYFALKDVARLPGNHPGKRWIWGAIWFGIFSTLGTMVLSYMMASRQYDQTTYLGSIYFYLHFQYNGWFLFTCTGLFLDRIRHLNLNPKHVSIAFWLVFLSGVPTFFLSTLWAQLPPWLYVVVVIASILQVIGWWYFMKLILSNLRGIQSLLPKGAAYLFFIVGSALILKIMLQLGSTIPEVSKLAFGFRPIVIAYLHLVLLLIVTVFLLTFLYSANWISHNKVSIGSLFTFAIGVILNEVVLAVQGIAAFSYTVIPFANEMLFFIALLMLVSAILLFLAQGKTAVPDANQA